MKFLLLPAARSCLLSRPARGGWIEIKRLLKTVDNVQSRPARGGWIEIFLSISMVLLVPVPPRTGRVD